MTDRKRSANSGEFVTAEYADTHPDTTVSESRPARAEEHPPESVLTPEKLAELQRLLDRSASRPWEWDDDRARPGLVTHRGSILLRCGALYGPPEHEAALIVAAVNALPALLDAATERDRLAALLDEPRRSGCAVEIAGVRIARLRAKLTAARDEAERLAARIEAAKQIGLQTHLGRPWANVVNDMLRALDGKVLP